MKTNPSTSEIFDLIQSGLSSSDKSKLMDPSRDPARIRHELSDCEATPTTKEQPVLPTVEEVTEAFNAHVLGGKAPYQLIVDLLSPFCDKDSYIVLEPGKGLKRPTYKISIPHLNLNFGRAATRVVALQIHHLAEQLTAFEVGDRAPENSPEVFINTQGHSSHIEQGPFKARNAATLLRTYATFFGNRYVSAYLPLEMSRMDLLKHVLAAREILAKNEFGFPAYRQQAAELIAAAQDLRMAATVAMRLNPLTPKHNTYWIEINPYETPMVKISLADDEDLSSHEKIAFISRNKAIFDALSQTIPQHGILKKLPKTYSIHMSGEADFLSINIHDDAHSATSADYNIPSGHLNYESLDDLAERLASSFSPKSQDTRQWRLEISGSIRSSHAWNLKGRTLSHAFAEKVKSDRFSSMVLTDLAIDLAGDTFGDPVDFKLYHVIENF
jgi:hypothetical protein